MATFHQSTQQNTTGWREGVPPSGTSAWVWYFAEEVRAVWNGRDWVDGNGRVLPNVTHYRT